MAANRRMTEKESEYYIRQVERRGRALRLPEAELAKWKEEYQRISRYLNREYKRFVISRIVRRRAYADTAVFNAFVEKEENGLIASAREMLNLGDAQNFEWFCWLMHMKYMCLWKIQADEKKAHEIGFGG